MYLQESDSFEDNFKNYCKIFFFLYSKFYKKFLSQNYAQKILSNDDSNFPDTPNTFFYKIFVKLEKIANGSENIILWIYSARKINSLSFFLFFLIKKKWFIFVLYFRIDPLDGTKSFVSGLYDEVTTLIGIA